MSWALRGEAILVVFTVPTSTLVRTYLTKIMLEEKQNVRVKLNSRDHVVQPHHFAEEKTRAQVG